MGDIEYLPVNIVLLDIRSIYLILLNRFNIIDARNPEKLAKKNTQQIFDNIIDDFQDKKLPALLIYLVLNADIIGLLNYEDYRKYFHANVRRVDKEYLEEVTEKCSVLYHLISNAITNM